MTNEAFLLTLKCPSCGSNLQISSDMDDFACAYCGTQQRVERRGGTISLKLIGKALDRVQDTLDKTNAELAIRRLRGQMSDIEEERRQHQLRQHEPDFYIAIQFSIILTVLGFLGALAGIAFASPAFLFLGLLVGILGIYMSYSIEASQTPEKQKRAEFERQLETRLAEVQAEINKQLAVINEAKS